MAYQSSSFSEVVQQVLTQPAYADHIRDLVARAFAGDEAARSELVAEFALSPSDLTALGRSPGEAGEFNELLARCSNARTIQTQAALTTFALFWTEDDASPATAAMARRPGGARRKTKGPKKQKANPKPKKKASAKRRRPAARPAAAKRAARGRRR